MTFLCFNKTPLGAPVEPEVYMMQQRSSASGGTGSYGLPSPIACSLEKLRTVSRG